MDRMLAPGHDRRRQDDGAPVEIQIAAVQMERFRQAQNLRQLLINPLARLHPEDGARATKPLTGEDASSRFRDAKIQNRLEMLAITRIDERCVYFEQSTPRMSPFVAQKLVDLVPRAPPRLGRYTGSNNRREMTA